MQKESAIFNDSDPIGDAKRVCFLLTVSGQNNSFLRNGALVTLESLRLTNPDIPVVIFFDQLDNEQRRLFGEYDLRQVDVTPFCRSLDALTHRPDLNSSVFLRFGVEDLHDYDVALYLDCDLVVLDNISDLFYRTGALVGRVMDDHPLVDQFRNGHQLLAQEQVSTMHFAINAGVVKYDILFWREMGLRRQVLELAQKYGWDEFLFCDQSFINLIGYKTGALKIFPNAYNFMMWPDMRRKQHAMATNSNGLSAPLTSEGLAKVVHWTGPIKPWQRAFLELPDHEQDLFCGRCYWQFKDLQRDTSIGQFPTM